MEDIVSLSGILKQYGPLGLSLLFISWFAWMRTKENRLERDESTKERKETHANFVATLEKKDERHERVINGITDKFATSIDSLNEQQGKLTETLGSLDQYVRSRGK